MKRSWVRGAAAAAAAVAAAPKAAGERSHGADGSARGWVSSARDAAGGGVVGQRWAAQKRTAVMKALKGQPLAY